MIDYTNVQFLRIYLHFSTDMERYEYTIKKFVCLHEKKCLLKSRPLSK